MIAHADLFAFFQEREQLLEAAARLQGRADVWRKLVDQLKAADVRIFSPELERVWRRWWWATSAAHRVRGRLMRVRYAGQKGGN